MVRATTTADGRVAVLAFLVLWAGALLAGSPAAAMPSADDIVLSSQTAFGPLTATGNCSSSNANQLPSRQLADTLDDGWFAATGYDSVSLGLFPPGDAGSIPAGSPYTLAMPGTDLMVDISSMSVPNGSGAAGDAPYDADLRTSTDPSSWGFPATSSDPVLTYQSQEQMSDCSVKPLSLVSPDEGGTYTDDPAGVLFWNVTGFGSAPERQTSDSVLFAFSEPVDNFGGWFGDLETRTDGEGQPAYVKLYDLDGNVLAVEVVEPSVQPAISGPVVPPGDPAFDDDGFGCGDQPACGNHGTRFIGFTRTVADVAFFQVIVGDDDHCVEVPTGCDSNDEHLSFVGPQFAADAPTVEFEKIVVNDSFGTLEPDDATFELVTDPAGAATVTLHAHGEVISLDAGTNYTVREQIPAGYSVAEAICVDGDDTPIDPRTIAPGLGDELVCTFTNDDVDATASIIVEKAVVNDDGGTLSPADVTLTVTVGADPAIDVASGDVVTVSTPAEVSLDELPIDGYVTTGVICIDGTGAPVDHPVVPEAGGEYRCTLTNDDVAAPTPTTTATTTTTTGIVDDSTTSTSAAAASTTTEPATSTTATDPDPTIEAVGVEGEALPLTGGSSDRTVGLGLLLAFLGFGLVGSVAERRRGEPRP